MFGHFEEFHHSQMAIHLILIDASEIVKHAFSLVVNFTLNLISRGGFRGDKARDVSFSSLEGRLGSQKSLSGGSTLLRADAIFDVTY